MYYKPGLKHYYYFRVCSNKYYCLLKKKNNRCSVGALVDGKRSKLIDKKTFYQKR